MPPARSITQRWSWVGGSRLLRVSPVGAGDKSASEPEVSFRFTQPDNLPT